MRRTPLTLVIAAALALGLAAPAAAAHVLNSSLLKPVGRGC